MKYKYNPTDHAVQRYHQRVDNKENRGRVNATKWVNEAIQNGIYSGEGMYSDNDGIYKYYKYEDKMLIVGDDNNVVTISYDNKTNIKELKKEVTEKVKKTIIAEIGRLKKQENLLLIDLYEQKINFLKAKNPKIKKLIQLSIADTEREVGKVKSSLDDVIRYATTKQNLVKAEIVNEGLTDHD